MPFWSHKRVSDISRRRKQLVLRMQIARRARRKLLNLPLRLARFHGEIWLGVMCPSAWSVVVHLKASCHVVVALKFSPQIIFLLQIAFCFSSLTHLTIFNPDWSRGLRQLMWAARCMRMLSLLMRHGLLYLGNSHFVVFSAVNLYFVDPHGLMAMYILRELLVRIFANIVSSLSQIAVMVWGNGWRGQQHKGAQCPRSSMQAQP